MAKTVWGDLNVEEKFNAIRSDLRNLSGVVSTLADRVDGVDDSLHKLRKELAEIKGSLKSK